MFQCYIYSLYTSVWLITLYKSNSYHYESLFGPDTTEWPGSLMFHSLDLQNKGQTEIHVKTHPESNYKLFSMVVDILKIMIIMNIMKWIYM